jgi:hypothetical protein
MIQVRKYRHSGELVWQWTGDLLERGDTWVCVQAIFDIEDKDRGWFQWQKGDRFVEWYYTDRWYNVFRIHDRTTDAVRGWYCNITRPSKLYSDKVEWFDLELDVFIYPNGDTLLLDEDEFHQLDLSHEERSNALNAVAEIRALAATGEAPFDM